MNWDLSTLWDSLKSSLSDLWGDTKQLAADGIGAALGSIPVPPFVSQMGDFFAAIPPDVIFYLQPFQFSVGLQMMMAAWVAGQAVRIVVGILA